MVGIFNHRYWQTLQVTCAVLVLREPLYQQPHPKPGLQSHGETTVAAARRAR